MKRTLILLVMAFTVLFSGCATSWEPAVTHLPSLGYTYPKPQGESLEFCNRIIQEHPKLKPVVQNLMENFKMEYDNFEEVGFFSSWSQQYDYFYIYPYIALTSSGHIYTRLKIVYYGTDWLFVDEVKFKVDGQLYTVNFDKYQEHDKVIEDNGLISERIDILVYDELFSVLEKISQAPNGTTSMKLGGDIRDQILELLMDDRVVLNDVVQVMNQYQSIKE